MSAIISTEQSNFWAGRKSTEFRKVFIGRTIWNCLNENENRESDSSHRLPLEDIENFFINQKANQSLPEKIHMHHIRKFTEKITQVNIDYYTWYQQRRPDMAASIFDCDDMRAEQRLFSKTIRMYDWYYQQFKLSDMSDSDVPAFVNLQENMTTDFMEETDRCYLFSIADNTVAALISCLKKNKLLKNEKYGNLLKNLPRITAHIRRIIQFFVVPSQVFNSKPCSIEIAMQKVRKFKLTYI